MAPEATRSSAWRAPKTSQASDAAMTSISSLATRPVSYLSPGAPSEGRIPRPEASSASARGVVTLGAGLRLKQSCSWSSRLRRASASSRAATCSDGRAAPGA